VVKNIKCFIKGGLKNSSQRPGLGDVADSVLRLLGLVLIKDMKMKIYSKAGLYS